MTKATNKAGGLVFIHSLMVHFLLLSLQSSFEIIVIANRHMSMMVISTIFERKKIGSSVESMIALMIFISCYSFFI